MSNAQPPNEPRNRLLAKLPAEVYRKLQPALKPVDLELNHVIYDPGGPIDHAYFAVGSVFSALTIMLDGGAIEVATIGNEGLIGHSAGVAIGRTSPHRVIVQVAGRALRIEARILRQEAESIGPLRELLADYQAAFMSQVSQSVACNGLHRLEQRCCRWLLMTRDRVASDDLRLSHEFLSMMLGARRASVTEVLRPLQEAGLIRSHRGDDQDPRPRRGGTTELRVLRDRQGGLRPTAHLAPPGVASPPRASSRPSTRKSASSMVRHIGGLILRTLPNSPPLPSSSPRSLQASRISAASVPAGSLVIRSRTSSTPSIRPIPRTSPIKGCRSCNSSRRDLRWPPTRRALPWMSSASMTSRVASPWAIETGLAPKVLK